MIDNYKTSMASMESMIMYQDDDILVCRKMAGMAVQNASFSVPDLESLLRNYLRGGYLAVVHRLDQPVEGIVVFAKNPAAAAGLSAALQKGEMKKEYLALVCLPEQADAYPVAGKWVDLKDDLQKDPKTNLSRVVKPGTKGAKHAFLSYLPEAVPDGKSGSECLYFSTGQPCCVAPEYLASCPISLFRIRLYTGRHHQIRVQLAHHGFPVLGDRKYGRIDEGSLPPSLALCAASLSFPHPSGGRPMSFSTKPSFLGLSGGRSF